MLQVINTITGDVAFSFDSIAEFNAAFPNGITEPHWELVKRYEPTFAVSYVCPEYGDIVTNPDVYADRLRKDDDGNTVYFYNEFFPACKVVKVVENSQASIAAKHAYFDQWGTACE